MILMIDNYDSFTYNLVQMFQVAGQPVEVRRNDEIDLAWVEHRGPSAIVISPGPSTPDRAGISLAIVRHFAARIPLLGICLGHQCIAAALGGTVIRARRLMHGKRSRIRHDGRTIYRGMPGEFHATRYHSLIVDGARIPASLEITAWTRQGEVMGLRAKDRMVEGIQFHPESLCTEFGDRIINNFIREYCS